MLIAQATRKDTGILKKMFAKMLAEVNRSDNDVNLKGEIERSDKNFSKLFKDGKYFLAEEGGKAVGFVRGKLEKKSDFYKNRRICTIYHLFVEKKYRKKGIGAALIKAIISWLKDEGIKNLELDVSPKNKTAIKLYKNLGFKESSIRMRKKI